MLYVDIHAHAYRRPLPFVTRFCTAEELISRYDRYGIELGFVLPVVNSEVYLPQANEDILEMVSAHPKRLAAFCNLDPRALINRADAHLEEVLAYYRDRGCLGVGEIMPNLRFDDARVQNLFACAEKVGLPVTTDGSAQCGGDFGLIDDEGLPALEQTLRRFPNLKFIAHGPLFWAGYSADTKIATFKPVFESDGKQYGPPCPTGKIPGEGVAQQFLRTFPNLYGELSDSLPQLRRDEEFAVNFLTEFQDRLFFGTDCCNADCEANFEIKKWFDYIHDCGKLPDAVWKKICRNNAIDYFNLNLERA